MKYLPRFFAQCSMLVLVPVAANAAGTYYNGNYQSPQRYANQTYSSNRAGGTFTQNGAVYNRTNSNGYNNYSYSASRNGAQMRNGSTNQQGQTSQSARQSSVRGNGFTIDAGISHEFVRWQFEMKEAGSKLHYDNVGWNVFNLNAAYDFNVGNTVLRVMAGGKYGMQSGESDMVDDDVSNGGYISDLFFDDANGNGEYDHGETIIASQDGHALSIGTSDGGNMYGLHMGFGMVDLFTLGRVKFTPSIGYRYFKYKLETKKNHGMAIDTVQCFDVNGEQQCDPVLIFKKGGADFAENIPLRQDPFSYIEVPSGSTDVDTAGTYYYDQPGVSHSYEVAWSGPYLAMDMEYEINKTNYVAGRVELGFPGYSATGDQPYRFDWAHPKSVEDKANMFSALHLGLGANWMTAITDTVSLSIGLTYDYYTVSGADSKTYLNGDYYETELSRLLNGGTYTVNGYDVYYGEGYESEAVMLEQNSVAASIADLEEDCPGWVCSSGGEIDSFYRSLGVRVGIVAKF